MSWMRSTYVGRVVGHVARGAHDLLALAEQALAQVVLDRAGADARALGELAHLQQAGGVHDRKDPCAPPVAGPATAPDSISAAISSRRTRRRPAPRGVLAQRRPGRAVRVARRAAELHRHAEQAHRPLAPG